MLRPSAAHSPSSRSRNPIKICASMCRWSASKPSMSCAPPGPPAWRSTRANACSSTETECEMPRTKPKSPSSPTSRNPAAALIAEQLRNAFEGEAWHGPAVLELLADIDPETAAAHPLPETHSIWEIALHIAAWDDAVNRRIVLGKHGRALQLNHAENVPPVIVKN